MGAHRLERTQLIPRPVAEVFPFFADAGNLARITPAWLGFELLTPRPIVMEVGARIDYRIRLLFGIPARWRTRIDAWEPGVRFVDTQERGPYRLWRHLHEFTPVDGGTLMRDVVDHDVGRGLAGALAWRVYVRRALDEIFDHRRRVISELFGPGPTVAATGGAAPGRATGARDGGA